MNDFTYRLYLISVPLFLLLGPMMTRFTHATLRMEKLKLINGQSLVLLLIGYVFILPYLIFPYGFGGELKSQQIQNLFFFTQLGLIVTFIISSSWHFIPMLWRLSKGNLYSVGYGENTYLWLRGVWLTISLVWLSIVGDFISDLFDHHPLWRDLLSYSINLSMFILLTLFTIRYCKKPHQENEITHCENSAKYENSALTNELAKDILNKVDLLMNTEQLFLDNNITLDKIASLINTQPQYLSQAINQYREVNFYEFIAIYRIEFAKKALMSFPTKNILDVAMSAGFNAKSTFNNTFKKTTGLTPTQYRIKHLHCNSPS